MNLDNLEQRVQQAMTTGTANQNDYQAFLQEAAQYAGQNPADRHNNVVAQIFQGLTVATMNQNGGTVPNNFPDTAIASYATARASKGASLAPEEATAFVKQMKSAVKEMTTLGAQAQRA